MKTRISFIVITLLAISSFAFASPAQDVFEQAQFYLETQYFGPNPVNMKEHTAKYQPMLDKACADDVANCAYEKAEPVIAQMLDDLNDGHAYYLSAAAVSQERANVSGVSASPTPRIGITHRGFCDTPTGVCEFDDAGNLKSKQIFDRLIMNVLAGTPGEKAGLKFGDRWVGYNDVLFSNAMDAKAASEMLADFTKRVRAKETIIMKIVRGVAREKLDISIVGEIINTVDFPSITLRSDGIGVLLIRDWLIQGLGTKVHDLVREAINKGAKSIVIDQRNNGGGLGNERAIAQGAFLEKPDDVYRIPRYNAEQDTVIEHYENGVFTQSNPQKVELSNQKVANPALFKGPIAMLVNNNCASACEYFASSIQRAKRGPIIGEETAGVGNTNTARFGLINGGAEGFPTLRAFWADGTPLPSSVKPDIVTPNSDFNLFNTGVDQPLQKALESFGAKTSANVSSITLSALPDFTGSSVMNSVMQNVSGNLEMVQHNNTNLQ